MSTYRSTSDSAPKDKEPTVAESVVQQVNDRAAGFLWDGEHAYVIASEDGHVRTLPVRSMAFKRWATSKMLANGARIPTSREQWSTVALRIEAMAERDGITDAPSIRVAGRGGGIYIDLGDDSWNCIKITKDGWTVEPSPADGPYLYRPARMAALPAPATGGSRERLWWFLNATEPVEQMLLTAYIVQANWPRGPYPVLPIDGPPGSAKTTRCSVLKALTDPTLSTTEDPAVTRPRKPPRDESSIIAAARNNRIVAFDNVSFLDQWLSDALCRLATGAELGDRGLYTDFDEAVFAACKPVILNGVPDVIGQSDLADRCIHTHATRPEPRMDEEEYWRLFREEWPELLGVVCDLISLTLKHWSDGKIRLEASGTDVRMKQYARIGESLGAALGWEPGSFARAYAENMATAARGIVEADPIFAPLRDLLAEHGGEWVGTMGDLLQALDDPFEEPKNWPKNARALSDKLARLDVALREVGIEVEKRRSNGVSTVTVRRALPTCTEEEPTCTEEMA